MAHEKTHLAKGKKLKKIRVWKVLALSAITIGIYPFVWLLQRNTELRGKTLKMQDWKWLLIASAVFLLVCFGLAYYAYNFVTDSQEAANIFVYGTLIIAVVAVVALLWWAIRTVLLINKALKIKPPTILVALTTIFFLPAMVAAQQYIINAGSLSKKKTQRVQKHFLLVTLVSVLVGVILSVVSFMVFPVSKEIENFKNDHAEFQKVMMEIKDLSTKYNECIDKLNARFPDDTVAEEDLDAYNAGYENCDKIYQQIQEK